MKPDFLDPVANNRVIQEMSKEVDKFENEYIKLIERMRELKIKE